MKTEGQRQSQKHEKRLAKKLGGSVNAASGALWSRKGDVRSDHVLLEHKYTGKKTFTLKAEDLEKNVKNAILEGRMPVFGIHLNGKNYAIIVEDDLLEILDETGRI